ncbi:MAG: Zn-ribbon domain-containing OB-fold protein [Deltaproteobacteria bacterium]|nr:Zn-ribbon domain-containing OB-fold protein [Deltaproteobacteria bacterium]
MSERVAVAKPLPRITPELEPFFAAARNHELVVQRCRSCGQLRFPAREVCPKCWSTEREWTPVSGRGEVFSFYWMHQKYHPAFADELPYAVVVVQLEEGPRMATNVLGCSHDELRIGMPVEVTFEERSPEITLPQFRPAAR